MFSHALHHDQSNNWFLSEMVRAAKNRDLEKIDRLVDHQKQSKLFVFFKPKILKNSGVFLSRHQLALQRKKWDDLWNGSERNAFLQSIIVSLTQPYACAKVLARFLDFFQPTPGEMSQIFWFCSKSNQDKIFHEQMKILMKNFQPECLWPGFAATKKQLPKEKDDGGLSLIQKNVCAMVDFLSPYLDDQKIIQIINHFERQSWLDHSLILKSHRSRQVLFEACSHLGFDDQSASKI